MAASCSRERSVCYASTSSLRCPLGLRPEAWIQTEDHLVPRAITDEELGRVWRCNSDGNGSLSQAVEARLAMGADDVVGLDRTVPNAPLRCPELDRVVRWECARSPLQRFNRLYCHNQVLIAERVEL
mmetsp:Transcript_1009/g.2798  ORF Transcript_1009/g.2798 Transcript_1009/m.2798 type:complete len:127 (-) Transcript_1009:1068-1448(-)